MNVFQTDKDFIVSKHRGTSTFNVFKYDDGDVSVEVDNGGTERALFVLTADEVKEFVKWFNESG